MPFFRRKRDSCIIVEQTFLGMGCNGTVVKKGSLSNGTDVAVKIVQLPMCCDREMEIMRRINHVNVLKLLHVEEDDNFR
jgi:hypothetical protein